MNFIKTKIQDVFLIEPDKNIDNRGFFARTYDKSLLFNNHINFNIKQTSISYNKKKEH